MPISDFGSHDPEFTQEQVDQCARIIEGVRAINTKIVRLSGSVEDLAAAANRIEALSASLDAVTQSRAMETFRFEFDASEPNNVMPFNPATGAFNPVAPKLEMTLEGKKLETTVHRNGKSDPAPFDIPPGGAGGQRQGWIQRSLAEPIQDISVSLPEKPVAVGDTWESGMELPGGRMLRQLNMPIRVTSTLEAIEVKDGVKCAKITQKMRGEAENQQVSGGQWQMTIKKILFEGEATAYVALDGGYIVGLTSKTISDGDYDSSRGAFKSKTTRSGTLALKPAKSD